MIDPLAYGEGLGASVLILTIIVIAVLALEVWTRIKARHTRRPPSDVVGVCIACGAHDFIDPDGPDIEEPVEA